MTFDKNALPIMSCLLWEGIQHGPNFSCKHCHMWI